MAVGHGGGGVSQAPFRPALLMLVLRLCRFHVFCCSSTAESSSAVKFGRSQQGLIKELFWPFWGGVGGVLLGKMWKMKSWPVLDFSMKKWFTSDLADELMASLTWVGAIWKHIWPKEVLNSSNWFISYTSARCWICNGNVFIWIIGQCLNRGTPKLNHCALKRSAFFNSSCKFYCFNLYI